MATSPDGQSARCPKCGLEVEGDRDDWCPACFSEWLNDLDTANAANEEYANKGKEE